MHQTFYIDIDEEITSIVDRLRKAKAKEVVLVVPKSALLIQSIVNLKLLKKEADNLKTQIMIVTQDKVGRLLIEKAGILVQNKLDESLEEEVVVSEEERESRLREKIVTESHKASSRQSQRLDRIGTDAYFSPGGGIKKDDLEVREDDTRNGMERITHKELVMHSKKDLRKGIFGRRKKHSVMDIAKENPELIEKDVSKKPFLKTKLSSGDREREIKLATFFKSGYTPGSENESVGKRAEKNKEMGAEISGKFWKSFLVFGGIFILALVLLGAYLFLPEAKIKIFAKVKTQSESFEVRGSADYSDINIENETVPAKIVEAYEEYREEFPSSGQKSVSNQKARGKVTIFNDYSSSSQTLVATTRLLSEDNKLFRLVSGVTVPGMEGGKSGQIEAEVVADEAGADFNIGPTRFTIPGFKSSGEEKYQKFYARSENSMTGGGSGNEEVKSITQADIDSAKSKITGKMGKNGKEKIAQVAGAGWVVLDEAVSSEDAEYLVSGTVGEVAGNFSVTVRVKYRGLVVRESDLKRLVAEKISQKFSGYRYSSEDVSLDFGKSDADFSNASLVLRFEGTVGSGASLDLENIKAGILGKNEEELKEYLESYSGIEKVEVEYWPPFIKGRIPMYEKRVQIELDK